VQNEKIKPWWHRWATLGIIFALFALLFYKLIGTWRKIPFQHLQFDGSNLAISYGFLLISSACGIEVWRQFFKTTGERVTFRQAFRLIGRTILAKYIPGRFWYFIGRVYLGKEEAFSQQRVAVATAMETLLLFMSAGMMLLCMELPLLLNHFIYIFVGLIAWIILGFILLHPRVVQRLLNITMRILKKEPVQVEGKYREYLGIIIIYLLGWITQGLGFLFLCRMILPVPWHHTWAVVGAYTLSWVVGFLAFFVPGGLGVRESVLTVSLGSILANPISVLLSLVSRVWITLYEVLFALIAFKI
jgi:hypothetical protein